ncbi:MAG TPA: pseudouridine synthase [Devosiaceae bacterium]|jgi:23S rRNA pseudouridine2605 synthase
MSESRTAPATGDRLAKVIARSGLCSRRDAETWIAAGRVVVNGKKVLTPAFNVTDRDKIEVDGAPLAERQGTRVWLYHKPAGLVVTEKDPEGRETIFEKLAEHGLPRVVTIGRLDINTEGLLLLTNDGGLKRVLELPATGWLRRYRVRAHGTVSQKMLDTLKDGIEIEGIKYGSIEATLEREQGANVWLLVALREGKNREVKNVLGALGLMVNRLIRVSYGPFQLGDLPIGAVEVVRARVLRDQLGKRLADEADVDFESEMPEARVEAKPVRDRDTGRGTNTVKIAQQRFRFTDRTDKTMEEVRAERPRQDRPGRSVIGRKPRMPMRADEPDVDGPPPRKIYFDDGREPAEFKEKSYGKKKPAFRDADDRPARSFGKPVEREKPPRTGGARPRRDSGTEHPRGPRRDDSGAERPRRSFGDKPRGERGAAAGADRGKPAFGDRPKRAFSDRPRPAGGKPGAERSERPARSFGDKPTRSFGDKPARGFGDKPRAPRDEAPARSGDRPERKSYPRKDAGAPGSRPPRRDGAAPAGRGPRKDGPPSARGPRSGGKPPAGPRKPRS